MSSDPGLVRVAVIGAGLAGAACAAGLHRCGSHVTVFEKSMVVGGRLAARRVGWVDADGGEQSGIFDCGAHGFAPVRPRFKAAMARAMLAGCVSEWNPRVHTPWSAMGGPRVLASSRPLTLCDHLLADATVHVDCNVRRLQRDVDGRWYVAADGWPLAGPFDQVAVTIPPAQAALLVAGHQDTWADALMARRMDACWTLMAVTDDVDWPWDAAEPQRGSLAWCCATTAFPAVAPLPASPSGSLMRPPSGASRWRPQCHEFANPTRSQGKRRPRGLP